MSVFYNSTLIPMKLEYGVDPIFVMTNYTLQITPGPRVFGFRWSTPGRNILTNEATPGWWEPGWWNTRHLIKATWLEILIVTGTTISRIEKMLKYFIATGLTNDRDT